jgi:hypothetical protein
MITDERLQHLSFLLSFPALAIASAVGDEPEGTSFPPVVDPTNDDDTDDTNDDTDDTASTPDDSEGPGVTTDGADAPGTSDDAGPGTTTDEPYGETTSGDIPVLCDGMAPPMVGMIRPTCIQYVGHYNDCWHGGMQAPECVYFYEAYCEYSIQNNAMMYGMACGAALEEFLACLSQVPCPQLADDQPDCVFESDEFDDLCM